MTEPILQQLMQEDERVAFLKESYNQVALFKRLLTQNLGAKDEPVLIISDTGLPGYQVAPKINVLYAQAAAELGLKTDVVIQDPKLHGDVAEAPVIAALQKLPKKSLILLNVSGRIGNLSKLGLSYRTFCQEHEHRFFSSSNWGFVKDEDFDKVIAALDIDYQTLSDEGTKLKELLDTASKVRVTTDLGTDITFDKTGKKSINNDGFYLENGRGGNMPAGEVYFPPIKRGVEGVIVIDGSLRTKDASLIPKEPVKLTIKNGNIVKIEGGKEADLLEETLKWAEKRAKYPWGIRRICELGIGLNPGATLAGCTILDEKVRGTIHVANGSNKWFGGDVAAIIHLDHVIKNPKLFIDGVEVPLPR